MREVDYRIVLGAIAGITIMESIALINGINGTILTMSVAVTAGLAGLLIKSPFNLKGVGK